MRKRQNRYVASASDNIDSLLEAVDADWDDVLSGKPPGGRNSLNTAASSRGDDARSRRTTSTASSRQSAGPPDFPRRPPVSETPNKLVAGLANLVKQDEGVFFSKQSTAFDCAKEQEDLHDTLSELMPQIKQHLSTYKEKVESLSQSWMENQSAASELDERVTLLQAENIEMQNALDIKALSSGYGSKIKNRRRSKVTAADEMRSLQEDLRREFLRGAGRDSLANDAGGEGEEEVLSGFRVAASLSKLINRITPIETSIKRIESSLGADVGAYFRFQRWLFLIQIPLFVTGFVLCLIHVINLFETGRSVDVLYGVGVLPGFMYHSTFTKDERFGYVSAVVVAILFQIISAGMMFTSASREYQEADITETDRSKKHARAVLMAWDNTATTETEVMYAFTIHEMRMKEYVQNLAKKGVKTMYDIFGLYLRRLAGLGLYAYVQIGCYIVVSFLSQIRYVPSGTTGADLKLGQFTGAILAPAIVSIMNFILTYTLEGLTRFEKWESEHAGAVLTVYRTYILIFFNLVVITASNILLVDPYMFAMHDATTIRKNLAPPFIDAYECRMNQASDAFLMNIVSDFAIHLIVEFLLTHLSPFITKQSKRGFDIIYSTASSFYFSGLVIFAIPFCPMILLISPIIFAIRFRFDVKSALGHTTRPKSSVPVHEIKYLLSVLHFVTVIFFGIVSAYLFLTNDHLPKNCAIQDSDVGLCVSNTLDGDLCSLDPDSVYHYYFSTSVNCKGGYPYCVCHDRMACGPFIDDPTPTKAFTDTMSSIPGIQQIWRYFFVESLGTWGVCIIVFLMQAFINNSCHVMHTAKEDKDKKIAAHIADLSATLKMYQKQSSQLQLMNRDDALGNDELKRPTI